LQQRNGESQKQGFVFEKTVPIKGTGQADMTLQRTAAAAIMTALKRQTSLTKHELEEIALRELKTTSIPDEFLKVVNKFAILVSEKYYMKGSEPAEPQPTLPSAETAPSGKGSRKKPRKTSPN